MSMIKITDNRVAMDDGAILATSAKPGCLYKTQNDNIIMAVQVPAKGYYDAFERNVMFISPDGRGWVEVSTYIYPIEGFIDWVLTGEK